jgi:hypothetical protein
MAQKASKTGRDFTVIWKTTSTLGIASNAIPATKRQQIELP